MSTITIPETTPEQKEIIPFEQVKAANIATKKFAKKIAKITNATPKKDGYITDIGIIMQYTFNFYGGDININATYNEVFKEFYIYCVVFDNTGRDLGEQEIKCDEATDVKLYLLNQMSNFIGIEVLNKK